DSRPPLLRRPRSLSVPRGPHPEGTPMPRLALPPNQMTFKDASELTGLSDRQLMRLAALGKLKTHAEPGQKMTVDRVSAERLAAGGGRPPAATDRPGRAARKATPSK